MNLKVDSYRDCKDIPFEDIYKYEFIGFQDFFP